MPKRVPLLLLQPGALRLLQGSLAGLAGMTVGIAGTHGATPAWRLETDTGCFGGNRTLIAFWQRPPFTLTVRLVTGTSADLTMVLGQVVIGTRVALGHLRQRAVTAIMDLLRSALAGRAVGSAGPWDTAAPAFHGQMLAAAWAQGTLRRLAQRAREKLTTEHWGVGIAAMTLAEILHRPLEQVTWLKSGSLGALADPFPLPGSDQILCERVPIDDASAGTLWRLTAGQDGAVRAAAPVPVTAGHHSYPFTTIVAGRSLFLPEAPERGATILYAFDHAGRHTALCHVAPGLRMADPTLFRHSKHYWIAYTDLDIGPHDNLCLLMADAVTGPWRGHVGNPVKIDIRSARPAGTPFQVDGRLYRPAQDCAAGYGAAVVVNRVDVLTQDDFQETPVRRLAPDARGPFPHGLHTVAADGDRLLLDGKRLVISPARLLHKALRRVTRGLPHRFSRPPRLSQ